MPIYEYRCQQCRHRFSHLWLSVAQASSVPPCPKCAGVAERILSRVARVRSEESRLEALADPGNFSGLDENDPASVDRWAKKMGQELGEDLGGDFSEALEEAAAEQAGEDAAGAADLAAGPDEGG